MFSLKPSSIVDFSIIQATVVYLVRGNIILVTSASYLTGVLIETLKIKFVRVKCINQSCVIISNDAVIHLSYFHVEEKLGGRTLTMQIVHE